LTSDEAAVHYEVVRVNKGWLAVRHQSVGGETRSRPSAP